MNKILEVVDKCKALKNKKALQNPWIPIFTRWFLVLAAVALAIGLTVHGVHVKIDQRVNELTTIAIQQYQAEQAAKDQEQQALLRMEADMHESKKESEIILMAKILAGINKFTETYGYSDGDLKTYLECVVNRAYNEGNGFGNSLEEVIFQKDQWTGFSENNQIIDRYYKIAEEVVNEFYSNSARPCSSDFCWAELRRDGIWLKNEFSESRYVKYWRY